MGYYSELSIEGTYHEGHSYPSPELQLKWRIEDLRSRLEDISTGNYASACPSRTWASTASGWTVRLPVAALEASMRSSVSFFSRVL